jgi:glutamine amidotransferase-like uncharacterized protein
MKMVGRRRLYCRLQSSIVIGEELTMAWQNTGWKFCVIISAAGALLQVSSHESVAADPLPAKIIRVAIYADEGASKKGSPQVQKCLPAAEGFEIKTLTAAEIRHGALDKFDVLIQPGGSGSAQAKSLGDEGRKRVKQFVADGGGFIGICAGAYLASAEYPWSLGLLDAHVIDDEHWARGQGDVELSISKIGRSALGIDEEHCPIRYNQGPLLGPGGKDDINDYELLATFESEIAKKGAPAGVMKGTAAIARGTFGKGRVQCFSPHPEKTPGREAFLQAAVRWVAQRD